MAYQRSTGKLIRFCQHGLIVEKTTYSQEYELLLQILRTAREEAGITQVDLASRLKTTQVNVSRYEGGQRGMDPIYLKYWCEAVGITVHDLYRELDAALVRLRAVEKSTATEKTRKKEQNK